MTRDELLDWLAVCEVSPFSEERDDLRSFVGAKAAWDAEKKIKALYPYFETDMDLISEEDEEDFIDYLEGLSEEETGDDGDAT